MDDEEYFDSCEADQMDKALRNKEDLSSFVDVTRKRSHYYSKEWPWYFSSRWNYNILDKQNRIVFGRFWFKMDERNVLPDSDKISVASDNTFFDIPGPQAEEATLSWRNDPLYKWVELVFHTIYIVLYDQHCVLFFIRYNIEYHSHQDELYCSTAFSLVLAIGNCTSRFETIRQRNPMLPTTFRIHRTSSQKGRIMFTAISLP